MTTIKPVFELPIRRNQQPLLGKKPRVVPPDEEGLKMPLLAYGLLFQALLLGSAHLASLAFSTGPLHAVLYMCDGCGLATS